MGDISFEADNNRTEPNHEHCDKVCKKLLRDGMPEVCNDDLYNSIKDANVLEQLFTHFIIIIIFIFIIIIIIYHFVLPVNIAIVLALFFITVKL